MSFLGAMKPPGSSWAWGSLLKLRSSFKRLFYYKLGRGDKFSFWYDPWLQGEAPTDFIGGSSLKDADVKRLARVNEVWINGRWRLPDPIDENVDRLKNHENGCSDKLGR